MDWGKSKMDSDKTNTRGLEKCSWKIGLTGKLILIQKKCSIHAYKGSSKVCANEHYKKPMHGISKYFALKPTGFKIYLLIRKVQIKREKER